MSLVLGIAFGPRSTEVEVRDALMDRVQRYYDARGLVELVATVAAYNMVSRFLVALQIAH